MLITSIVTKYEMNMENVALVLGSSKAKWSISTSIQKLGLFCRREVLL